MFYSYGVAILQVFYSYGVAILQVFYSYGIGFFMILAFELVTGQLFSAFAFCINVSDCVVLTTPHCTANVGIVNPDTVFETAYRF